MNRKNRFAAALLAALLILTVPAAAAGLYHAPVLTLIAPFAPSDLKVSINIVKQGETIPVVLESQRRGWEMQYFLRREGVYGITAWYGNAYDLKDAELVLEHGGETRTVPIPAELLGERDSEDYLSLNWRSGTLKPISAWRAPLLLLLWTAIVLAVEAVVFYLYGYRNRRSWIVFLLVNLVTQGAHRMLVSGINVDVNRVRIYIMLIPLLLLVEMIAFVMLIDERSRDRTITCAVVSNVASQVVLGILMAFPVCLPS